MKYKSTSWDIEAAIQAELYIACRKAHLHCALEYLYEDCRFDLVVIEHNQVISIVEVKTPILLSHQVERSAQVVKYKKYDIPIFILYSIYDIPYLVKRLLEVRKKFLESAPLIVTECFEADRQNEEKWNKKIEKALSKFDEIFPDYQFTKEHSLEILAEGVRVCGLSDVLGLLDIHSGFPLGDFFFSLSSLLNYNKSKTLHELKLKQDGSDFHSFDTASDHHNKLSKIAEKLN